MSLCITKDKEQKYRTQISIKVNIASMSVVRKIRLTSLFSTAVTQNTNSPLFFYTLLKIAIFIKGNMWFHPFAIGITSFMRSSNTVVLLDNTVDVISNDMLHLELHTLSHGDITIPKHATFLNESLDVIFVGFNICAGLHSNSTCIVSFYMLLF